MRPDSLDKLILQQMCRLRRNKIDRIEEEDEGNSSLMQSYKSEDKRDELRRKSELEQTAAKEKSAEKVSEKKVTDTQQTSSANGRTISQPPNIRRNEDQRQQELSAQVDDIQKSIHKRRSKSNSNIVQSTIEESAINSASKIKTDTPNFDNFEPAVADQVSSERGNGKTSISGRRLQGRKSEAASTYKVNSVSLLNMLQNKTLSLIKNVRLIDRFHSGNSGIQRSSQNI